MEKETLIESLYFYNPWWEKGKVSQALTKEYQRPIIQDLFSYLSLDRIVVLKGPRRTGKTTLFYQIINRLLKRGVAPNNILFLSFDDIKIRMDLDQIFKAYQEATKRLVNKGETVYVFLDEVHFLENWQFYVKKYFDRKYPLKFLVSGSAASLIKKGTESLAGRTIEETIYPFSFYEYLSYRLKNKKLMAILIHLRDIFIPFTFVDIIVLTPYVPEIKIVFEEYLEKGGFPNLFDVEEELLWKRLLREDIVEKVIYRDMVELYGIKKPEILEKLFLYVVNITSQILSVSDISNSLGLSREYSEKYLLYLEQALLIKRLKKYAKSIEKSLRSQEKVHLLDPGLINAFSRAEKGRVLESMVASHLLRDGRVKGGGGGERGGKRGKVYYFRDKYEVDLVYEIDNEIFPVEIKYKDEISKRDLSGLYSFHKKFNPTISVVVTRDLLKEETSGAGEKGSERKGREAREGRVKGGERQQKIIYFPAWLFLLLLG